MRSSPPKAALLALGDAISEARRTRGLTQAALAARAGLHDSYISVLETGMRNPTYGTLLAISDALGVPLAQLVKSALNQIAGNEANRHRRPSKRLAMVRPMDASGCQSENGGHHGPVEQ